MQYLELIRSLEQYNSVTFPHCKCDARKDGHIRLVVSLSEIKLQACDDDGNSQVHDGIKLVPLLANTSLIVYTGPGAQFSMGHDKTSRG